MQFVKESFIQASAEIVFAFHEAPEALKLLIPPWESARVIQAAQVSRIGSRAVIESKVWGPFKVRWVAEHTVYNSPHDFEDIQVEGPFRSWRHRHVVEPRTGGAILRDEITYEPPLGFLGRWLAPGLINGRLQRLFDYRHEVTRRECEKVVKSEKCG
jgi:ligand-binding SRPBCC domain-containing protein